MAIKILWTLEGTEKILSDQEKVAKKGEEVGKRLGDIGKGGVGVDKLVKDLQGAGLSFDQASDKSLKFGTAIKALSGALRLVGVDIEGLGAAGALLNKTLAGAGVAIAGGIVVGLGKLEEASARTLGQLSDTFGSAAKGQQAFAALESSASKFGSSVDELAPGLIALQTALNNVDRTAKGFRALREEDLPGGGVRNVEKTAEAYNNFINILRAGRQTQDQAAKSATAFFEAFTQGPQAVSAALAKLPIGTIKLLQEAVGAAGLRQKEFIDAVAAGTLPVERFAAALANFGPQAQKAFDTKAIKTMGDALNQIIADLQAAFKDLAGVSFSQAIIAQLEEIGQFARTTAREVKAIIDTEARLRAQALERLIQPAIPTAEVPLPRPRPEAVDSVKKGFIDLTKTVQDLGGAAFNTGQKMTQGLDKATAAATQTTAAVRGIADAFQGALTPADLLGDELETAAQKAERLQETGSGGEAAKGRLGQIPVFVPQLAGQGGQQSGQQFGEQWVQAVQQEIGATDIEFDINTQIDEAQRTLQLNVDENAAINKAEQLFEQIKQIFQQIIPLNIDVGSGLSGIGGTPFARGGQIRGPGSTTSDSILARLSNREWVINARAVDFYGSNLFAALNSMRLPRHAALPKFAEGGQASTPSSSLTLVLGGRSFETSASESTVTALRRFAVHSQLASIGRKPGFVR